MPPIIRLADGDDAEHVQAIYAPVVRDTAISFETEIPDVQEMRQRILSTLEGLPWLVCEVDGKVLGYVYAGRHRARAAYQWAVEVSVYIHPDARRLGVGRALYSSLFQLLALQGFSNLFAGITLPNDGSVGIHERLGFQPIGVYKDVGYKFGSWHDVGWWQLPMIQSDPPSDPKWLPEIAGSPEWDVAMGSGLSLLNI